MDALEFLKERRRMCSYYQGCDGCALKQVNCSIGNLVTDEGYSKVITTVEQWSKKHQYQHKTRQSEFLKQYPNVMLDTNGIINISSCQMDPGQYQIDNCCRFIHCDDCRREFWSAEVR